MKPELAALLLVEEFRRRDEEWQEAGEYLAFIRSQAVNRKSSRSYGYYLACRIIEGRGNPKARDWWKRV